MPHDVARRVQTLATLGLKFYTSRNHNQQVATTRTMRSQHVFANNVACCCMRYLRALVKMCIEDIKHTKAVQSQSKTENPAFKTDIKP